MEDKKDEITIDFSRITNFFRKKRKEADIKGEEKRIAGLREKEKELKEKIKEEQEDIKELKKEEAHVEHGIKEEREKITELKKESKEDEEIISIDFKGIIKRVKNIIDKHPAAIILILLLVLQFLPNAGFLPWGGVWMRLTTKDLPITDDWAISTVYNYYKGQIASSVNQQYPNLPDARKNQIVEEEFQKLLKSQKDQILQQIGEASNAFKSQFQYELNGKTYTYMPDIDPYAFLRYTRNLIEKGSYEDEKKNGKRYDTFVLAPLGTELQISLHPYTLLLLYKIGRLFNRGVDLIQPATYFPIIFVTLSIALAFLVGRKLAGNVGGFFAATMLAVNNAAASRTTWGHADTDAYNLFFPLIIILFFILSVESEGKSSYIYSIITGLFMGLYAFAWSGWWYLLDFLLMTVAVYFVYLLLKNRKLLRNSFKEYLINTDIKKIFLLGILLFVSSAIFVALFTDFATFNQAVKGPLSFLVIKAATGTGSIWPNVYTTVAELNPASIEAIISSSGGKFVFLIAALGIILLLFGRSETKKGRIMYSMLLTIWILSTIYASTKGIRFTLLLAPAFAIAFGVALGILHRKISEWTHSSLHVKKAVVSVIVIILFAFLPTGQAKATYGTVKGDLPLINDAWWNALTSIRDNSEKDAIINSWWDFGHHFKFIAERRVTFDGGTQSTPMAHWIGRVLITENEDEALGILRMLDCGSTRAFEAVDEEFNDTGKSVKLLYEIFALDKEEAKKVLSKKLKNPDKVLKYTHCEPPEDYFITSSDMVSKAGVWAHFGSWNFERAYLWIVSRAQDKQTAVADIMEKFGYDKDEAERIYFEAKSIANEGEANNWIAPWPGYSNIADCSDETEAIMCGNGLVFNKTAETAVVRTQQGDGIPDKIVYINKNNRFTSKKLDNATTDIAVIIIPSGDSYRSVFSSPQLGAGMFTRLYFFDGHGLKNFKLFNKQAQITGGNIHVWKIDWKGEDANLVFKPKEIISQGDNVKVDYIGYLEDGTVFDSSIKNWKGLDITKDSAFDGFETSQLSFKVGAGNLIKGFEQGVVGMKIEEEKILEIPPEEGYGTDPGAHPLANKTLYFKVKVREIS